MKYYVLFNAKAGAALGLGLTSEHLVTMLRSSGIEVAIEFERGRLKHKDRTREG